MDTFSLDRVDVDSDSSPYPHTPHLPGAAWGTNDAGVQVTRYLGRKWRPCPE